MQLRDIQQQIADHVEVYDECLLKLAKCLHVITTNVFITIFFKAILLPYLRLTTADMRRNTLIEHKEVVVVCEESGPISLNYNVLLTTPETKTIVKHVIHVVITISALACTNYGKISHSIKTYHN
jgi:hypothetical protein